MSWRYEIKYRVPGAMMDSGRNAILSRPFVRRSYPARHVNSIYLDTPQMAAALDNLTGVAHRSKHRVRWYGTSPVPVFPVYEVKTRQGRLGRKDNFELSGQAVADLHAPDMRRALSRENEELGRLLSRSEPLVPVLGVHYDREYFVGPAGVRVTIDQNLRFRDLRHNNSATRISLSDMLLSIVEVKFSPDDREVALDLIRSLPLQPMRNSKYILGLSCLNALVYL